MREPDPRVQAHNPIHPFTWAAFYRDGSALAQFGADGRYHRTDEIDLDRLEGVFIGEPGGWHSVLPLPRARLAETAGPWTEIRPDRVCLFATVEIERAVPAAPGVRGWELSRRVVSYTFGFEVRGCFLGMVLEGARRSHRASVPLTRS